MNTSVKNSKISVVHVSIPQNYGHERLMHKFGETDRAQNPPGEVPGAGMSTSSGGLRSMGWGCRSYIVGVHC